MGSKRSGRSRIEFAELKRAERLFQSGWPADAVAAEIGIDRKTAQKIERGRHAEQINPRFIRCPCCGSWVRPPCMVCLDRKPPIPLSRPSDRIRRLLDEMIEDPPRLPNPPAWLRDDWSIGAIVGRAATGKTSILRSWFPGAALLRPWPELDPIVDCFDLPADTAIVSTLDAVGMESPRNLLSPYGRLASTDKALADLARILSARDRVAGCDDFLLPFDIPVAIRLARRIAKALRAGTFRAARLVVTTSREPIAAALKPDWIVNTPRFTRRGGGDPAKTNKQGSKDG